MCGVAAAGMLMGNAGGRPDVPHPEGLRDNEDNIIMVPDPEASQRGPVTLGYRAVSERPTNSLGRPDVPHPEGLRDNEGNIIMVPDPEASQRGLIKVRRAVSERPTNSIAVPASKRAARRSSLVRSMYDRTTSALTSLGLTDAPIGLDESRGRGPERYPKLKKKKLGN